MQFNIRTGNYAQAGKAAADDLVRSFAAARRNSPDFGKMAQQAQVIRSKVKQEGINAASQVTRAGIEAAGDVKSHKVENDARMKRDSAKRKAGALAVAGKMFGQAGEFMGEKRTKREIGGEDSWFQTQIDKAKQKATDLRTKADTPTSMSTPSSTGDETDSGNSGGSTEGSTVSPDVSANHSAGPGKLTKAQIKDLAIQQGFSPEQASTVVGIAGGESGFDPTNSTRRSGLYDKTGEDSVGLMQINWGYHKGSGWLQDLGITSREQLFDPATNLKAAKYLYDGRGDFGDWTVYNEGIYQDYL